MIFIDNEFMLVDYDEKHKYLYHKRRKLPDINTYQDNLTMILNLVVSEKIKYWLCDASESDRLPESDENWLLDLLDVYSDKIAIEKFALVLPFNAFNLLSAESIISHLQQKIKSEIQYFTDYEPAQEWLEESFREICFTEDNLDIEFNSFHNWIYADWKGYHSYSSIRKGCELIFDLVKAKSCHKLFNDNRHALGDWQEATQWIVTEWMPRMEEIGLQSVAWMLSPSNIHRATAQEIFVSLETKSQVQIFNDYYAAKNWLKSS